MKKSIDFNISINSKKSFDKRTYSPELSSLNIRRRHSIKNSLKYIMAKKDFEKLKKLKKKNYYSNAKLNVINILNNCINEDFYDEFSIIEKNCSKNDDKKIKKEKKKE